MPAHRQYVVTREQEVKVSASSPVDAVRVANAVFNDEKLPSEDISGLVVRNDIKDTSITAREAF